MVDKLSRKKIKLDGGSEVAVASIEEHANVDLELIKQKLTEPKMGPRLRRVVNLEYFPGTDDAKPSFSREVEPADLGYKETYAEVKQYIKAMDAIAEDLDNCDRLSADRESDVSDMDSEDELTLDEPARKSYSAGFQIFKNFPGAVRCPLGF